MLTALHIEDHTGKGLKRLCSLLRHNRIRVAHLYCDSAAVRSVVYEHRRGQISWAAIGRFVGGGRRNLLCPPGTQLPSDGGWKRFDDRSLNRRLCENAATVLLRAARGLEPRVVLADDSGERAGFCAYLTEDTDSLTVVTRSPELYLTEADRILEERGAVIPVSSGESGLSDADLIIAPDAITRDLRCSPDAVILSGEPPLVRQRAPVIYDYTFDLPEKYRAMCPPYLDEMYFAAALYSLAGVHELGASVFRRCYDGRVLHTRVSLLEQLRVRLQNREKSAAKS